MHVRKYKCTYYFAAAIGAEIAIVVGAVHGWCFRGRVPPPPPADLHLPLVARLSPGQLPFGRVLEHPALDQAQQTAGQRTIHDTWLKRSAARRESPISILYKLRLFSS